MLNKLVQSLYSWVILVGVVVVIITGNSFYVVSTLDDLAALEARLFSTNRVINAINTLHMAILRAESGQRGYLLTGDDKYLVEYTATLNRLNGLIDEVEISALASDLPEQTRQVDQLLELSKVKLNELIRTVEIARAGNVDEAINIVQSNVGLQLYDRFQSLFRNIDNSEREMQGKHLANLMQLRRDSVNTLLISALTTALLIISIFVLLKLNMRETFLHQRALEESNEELEDKIALRTQELKLYSEELARSNRELEDFAFVASHDLQEPLRKIRAFGNRLDSGYNDVIDERGKDFLKRMLSAAERMSMLITDLLAFSRIATRGKAFESVDINEVFENVLEDLEIAIEEGEAVITLPKLPTIQADKSQFEQLVLNLISNALKFKKDNETPVITVSYRTPAAEELSMFLQIDSYEWIQITIEDNGIGFDQSFAEKIFAPFQRLHGRSSYKGTGIGLAVCRRIVERHNGEIRAYSEPGKGTKFVITMPTNGEPFATTNSEGVVSNAS
ncbi:histidine kinase [Alteromonas pelagimontana]|uniref:histidine kinase n=1 Tax=Alteromonas pelagimontana TaxID=1858656 RepID=A0A6M4MGV9_9ALTE|nr:sensor histidine kinase [Alteromonas pelagimontana]QJR82313.1 histidine kinase [Alteromonas pelagimontana]